MRRALQMLASRAGFALMPMQNLHADGLPKDLDSQALATIREVNHLSMTSPDQLFAVIQAARYVCSTNIDGAFVECGVWRGGSAMAAARTFQEMGDLTRDLYLYDTYEGMPPAGAQDIRVDGEMATELLADEEISDNSLIWARAGLDSVKAAMTPVAYPEERVNYVVGRVEDTIPAEAPEAIALLHLDTDWYESTAHELKHLMPRVAAGGVVIIDDYGFWEGVRKAVDEYLEEAGLNLLLTRIDHAARLAVVP